MLNLEVIQWTLNTALETLEDAALKWQYKSAYPLGLDLPGLVELNSINA